MNVIDHVEAANPEGPLVIDLGDFKVYRPRNPILAGNHKVSIQASETHYCTPRQGGLSLAEYEAVEIALWPADQHQNWATPENTSFLKPYSDFWGGNDVAANVPWETVQAIVDAACDAATRETDR